MWAELQFVLVAPEDFGFDVVGWVFNQHVVEVDDLVAGSVAYQDEHATLVGLETVFDECLDSWVYFLFHFVLEILLLL